MHIVSIGDKLYMRYQKPVFLGKIKKIKLASVEIVTQHAKR